MAVVKIPLGPSTDPGRSTNVGAAALINCYPEKVTDGAGKVRYALYGDHGLRLFSDIGGVGNVRGLFALGNVLYAVSGEKLYRLSSVGATTEIGNVFGQKPVLFSHNRKTPNNQITIVADTIVYTLENNVLTVMPDTDLPVGVHSSTYIDGVTAYGLNDARFFWSDINESNTIEALDFIEAEAFPDNGVRVITVDQELWYFGAGSLQVFDTAIDQDEEITFVPKVARGQGSGSGAKHSVVIFDNSVVEVNDIGQVVRFSGYSASRISNHAVERDIQVAKVAGSNDEITAFAWPIEGHWFYFLCLPDATWVFDAATSEWHRKESYGLVRSRIRFYTDAFGKTLVGDADGANIYELASDAYDEAGDYLITTIISAPISAFPGGGVINSFWIDAEMGVGTGTADHSANPKVMVRVSTDGQKTWSAPEERELGAQGHFTGQLRFNNLGMFGPQGVSFKVSISSPVKRAILDAYADIEALEA